MTTTSSERHLRLVFLLLKGGTKLTRRLLEKRVQDLKPELHNTNTPWTVDCFLLQHDTLILNSKLGREKSAVYFPGECKTTDLDSWDLNMFCFVLSKLCRLTDDILTVIDDLRDMRNELCHTSDPSLEYDIYTQKLRKFKVMATQICTYISDDPFKNEIQDFIEKVESEPLSTSDIVTTMHKFYAMERETKDALTTISEDQKKALTKIEEIHRMLYNKEGRITLPETDIEILVWNCSKEKEIKLSEILVKLIDQKIKESPELADELSNDHMVELKKAVSEAVELFLSNGWKISSTEIQCILLRVQCETVGNLVKLFRDCISGEIKNILKPVENAIRKIQDFDGVSLEAVICEEEFWRAASITISVLADRLRAEDRKPDATISLQVAQAESDIYGGTKLNLKIHHQTSMQRDKLIEAFKTGEVMTRMKNIEDAVAVDYDNVKIKAILKSTDLTAGDKMEENHPITIAYQQTNLSPKIEDRFLKRNSQRCLLREDGQSEDLSPGKTDEVTKTSQEIDEREREDTLNASLKFRRLGNSIVSDKIDSENDELNQNLKARVDSIAEEKKLNEKLRTNLQAKNDELIKTTKDVKAGAEERENLQRLLENKSEELQEMKAELQTQLQQMKLKYDQLNEDNNNRLQEKVDESEQLRSLLNKKSRELQEMKEDLQTELHQMKSEYDKLNEYNKKLLQEKAELQTQRHEMKSEYDKLNEDNKKLLQEKAELQTQLHQMKSKYDQLNEDNNNRLQEKADESEQLRSLLNKKSQELQEMESKHQSVEMESDRVRTELPYIMPNEDDDFPIWVRREDIVTNNIRTSDVHHEQIIRETVLHNYNPDSDHHYDVIAEATLCDIIGKEGPSNTAAANLELASCDTSHTNERTVARLGLLDSFQNVYLNYPYSAFGDDLNRNLSKTSSSAMYGSPDEEYGETEYIEWSQTNRECRGYNSYEAYATEEETIHYNNQNTESITKPSVDQWNKTVIPRKSLAHVMVNPICGNNLHMSSEEDSCLRGKIQTDAHKDTEDNTETKQYSSTQRKLHTFRYEEVAILFRNLIVSTMVVRQILPHLHACLDFPDIEHLRQLSSHNNREAAEKLLDLIHSSPEPGKWKMLVEALERSGNKLLVKIMRQSVDEDNDEQIKVFNMVTPKLREMICPSELIPYLRNADIINGDDAEEIIAKEKHYGCIAAADILLQCIPKKHPKWFDLLLSAFVSAGRLDLKEILEFGIANETREENV